MQQVLEDWLKQHATYDPDEPKIAPLEELRTFGELHEIASGLQARVFTLSNHQTWVVKEGRWDLDFQLFKNFKVSLPAQLTENVWKQFSQTFLPTQTEILRQYRLYLTFTEYFGLFTREAMCEDCYEHPHLDALTAKQQALRARLSDAIEHIEHAYSFKLSTTAKEQILSVQHHNFLPKEYLLIGPSVSPQNGGKLTSFIFQPFVNGTNFHDVRERELKSPEREQCMLFLVLLLLLHDEKHLLPDTRPRYPVLQMFDWLTKTDNIIVSDDGLKFIDTRWFWETDSNFVKRGLFVPEIVINQAKNLLVELASSQLPQIYDHT
jgi:hypothetical protein